jgi:DNA-binding NtrC family response regulator
MLPKLKMILHVEDDQSIANALKRVLRDCTIVHVINVHDAKSALRNIRFDAVITDFNLGAEETGGDLIKWIAAEFPNMLAKTILFTGNYETAENYPRVILKPAMGEVRQALIHIA